MTTTRPENNDLITSVRSLIAKEEQVKRPRKAKITNTMLNRGGDGIDKKIIRRTNPNPAKINEKLLNKTYIIDKISLSEPRRRSILFTDLLRAVKKGKSDVPRHPPF